jgi:hypothetical protein
MFDARRHRRRPCRKQRHISDLSPLRIFLKLRVCRRESRAWQRCQNCGPNLQGTKSNEYQRARADMLSHSHRKVRARFRDNSEPYLDLGRCWPCAARRQSGRARDFLRERILLERCAKRRNSSTIRAHGHYQEKEETQAPCPQIRLLRPRLGHSYLRKSPSTLALAFSNPFGSTLSHVESGSNWVMAVARLVVFAPRSF